MERGAALSAVVIRNNPSSFSTQRYYPCSAVDRFPVQTAMGSITTSEIKKNGGVSRPVRTSPPTSRHCHPYDDLPVADKPFEAGRRKGCHRN